jgi:hypothetical protein
MGYTDGVNSLTSLSPTAKADVLKALGSGFDTVASDANAGVRASNIGTGGTAAVRAGDTAYQNANTAYQRLANVTIPNIEGFGQLLMQGAGGINPFDSQHANMTVAAFQNELSDSQRGQFNATFQQLQKSIAELAGAGGTQTPTQNVIQSDGTLNPNAKLSTIQDVLSRIAAEGAQYLKTQGSYSNNALNQTQGGSGNTGGTGGNTSYAGGGAF